MSSEDQDCTIDDSRTYESPIRSTKSQRSLDSSVTKYHQRRMQEMDRLFIKFKEEQNQMVTLQVEKLQRRKHCIVIVVILLCLLLVPIYALDSELQQMSFRVNELEYKQKQMLSQVKQLQAATIEQHEIIEGLQSSLQNINQQILDLHMNELTKEEKSMLILQKYTNSFIFSIDFKNPFFKSNYAAIGDIVRKRTQQQVMFYSSQPIPSTGVYYLKIQIEETMLGMISFGIIPASKKKQECVYCDSSQIYYIYCKNGNMYNGEILKLVNKSTKSKFQQIKSGDTVTMFVDNNEKKVIWYVNSRYAGSQKIKENHKQWYPFVEMTSRGDHIKLLK